mgnify:CR=1 FL=1
MAPPSIHPAPEALAVEAAASPITSLPAAAMPAAAAPTNASPAASPSDSSLNIWAHKATLGLSSCQPLVPLLLHAPISRRQKAELISGWIFPIAVMRETAMWTRRFKVLLSLLLALTHSASIIVQALAQFHSEDNRSSLHKAAIVITAIGGFLHVIQNIGGIQIVGPNAARCPNASVGMLDSSANQVEARGKELLASLPHMVAAQADADIHLLAADAVGKLLADIGQVSLTAGGIVHPDSVGGHGLWVVNKKGE